MPFFILDHYIQICQICEKFRVVVDVITNGDSTLQLKNGKVFSLDASVSQRSLSSTCSLESLKLTSQKSHSSHNTLDHVLRKT